MADAPAAEPTPSPPASASAAPSPTPAVAAPAVAAAPATPAAPAPAAAAPVAPAVPDKYDFAAVKLPEGMALDVPLLTAMEPLFKKHGLTQEAASEFVAEHAKALSAIETKKEADFKTWMADQVKQHQATIRNEWGLQHDANLQIAQRGLARITSPAMKALLDETGLGSHPEFVKAFFQVGKMVSEDMPPAGALPPGTKRSAAEVLYGATTPNH